MAITSRPLTRAALVCSQAPRTLSSTMDPAREMEDKDLSGEADT
jgi:hypothetical protein